MTRTNLPDFYASAGKSAGASAYEGVIVDFDALPDFYAADSPWTRPERTEDVIRRTKKYHVHDEQNAATLGDLVRIEECRPISRLKRWQLMEVLTERAVAEVSPESLDRSLVEEMQRSAAHTHAEEAAAAAPAGDAGADGATADDGEQAGS